MSDFVVTPEGWLQEVGIHDAAVRATQLFPEVDTVTFEASTLLIRVFKSVRDSGEAYLEPYGLTPSRIPVLETIHRSDQQRLTIREIASALRVTPTNVSKMIDALEKDGWVRRIPKPGDGRSSYAELTDVGLKQLEQIIPKLTARRMELWSVLTIEEKQILSHLLAKLHMNVLSKSIKWPDVSLDLEEVSALS